MISKAEASLPPVLSPRQRQILKLLQEGKVNKEVAEELDIGLGTVKQHIVALFKKLKVSNRAMAVSRGLEILKEQSGTSRGLMVDGLLERRPCVVLCLALAVDAAPFAVRMLRGWLAELAAIHDAVFVARKGNAAELIFGIQQVTEYDLACAIRAAGMAYQDLQVVDPQAVLGLKGSLNAGFAVASMKRFGGWTGEAIASSAIAEGRVLLDQTPAGTVTLAPSVMELLSVFGTADRQALLPLMSFEDICQVQWAGSRPSYRLVGRIPELKVLRLLLSQTMNRTGALISLRGEMGMGKSRLCEELVAEGLAQGGQVEFFRCLPTLLDREFYDLRHLGYASLNEVAARLTSEPALKPALVIIDDFHLLGPSGRANLGSSLQAAVNLGNLVVLAARKPVRIEGLPVRELRLRRLNGKETEMLVRNALEEQCPQVSPRKRVIDSASAAVGVPLFAVALAHNTAQKALPLSLQVVINARLHALHLDRVLLQALAQNPKGMSLAELAFALNEDQEQLRLGAQMLVELGILKGNDAQDGFAFAHPVLRRAIIGSSVD